MQRQMSFNEPRLRPLLDGAEEESLADWVSPEANSLPFHVGCHAGSFKEMIPVWTQETLRSLVVAVVLNQPHHLLGPGSACGLEAK